MKAQLSVFVVAFFLLFRMEVYTQTIYTVDVPGTSSFVFFDGGSGYGGGNQELKVGKNGNTFRSYITWNNILTYIPAYSIITNVEFYITWTGNGSTTAQINYKDYTHAGSSSQIYQNIGSGTLWGTKVATTATYSFSELSTKIQSIVNGTASSPVRIGIQNQDESNSNKYVYYGYNVSLRINYKGNVEITQLDESSTAFGQVGR